MLNYNSLHGIHNILAPIDYGLENLVYLLPRYEQNWVIAIL